MLKMKTVQKGKTVAMHMELRNCTVLTFSNLGNANLGQIAGRFIRG